MSGTLPQRLFLHIATFCVWSLVAASAVYWFFRISERQLSENFSTIAESKTDSFDAVSLARLLGAVAPQALAPVAASSRYALKGVVSGAPGKEAALISIDNKPALTFKVGSTIEEGIVLQSASARKVTLSTSRGESAVMTLEMPLIDK